jgi:hypothetical protein
MWYIACTKGMQRALLPLRSSPIKTLLPAHDQNIVEEEKKHVLHPHR